MNKHKIIIDTDPGVDDTNALIFALFENELDIKLITTVTGNIKVNICTRNMCHILDLFQKDIPVVKGATHAMDRYSPDAAFLHGKEGMGGYIPPKQTIHQPLQDKNAVDEMYRVIMENPHEITIFEWGPHTNLGFLFTKHPDCIPYIQRIIFMGASIWGVGEMPKHISFNVRTDPKAFDIVLHSGVPLVMVPSSMGRFKARLTKDQVMKVVKMNDVGKFMGKTFETYWERGVPTPRIATNDTCALFYLLCPQIYKTKNAEVNVSLSQKTSGKTVAKWDKKGHVKIVMGLTRYKYINMYMKKLKALSNIKLDIVKNF